MAIPNLYQTEPANVLASYGAIDVATGRALQLLYAGDVEDGSYILAQNSFYSHIGGTASGENGTIDKDFDLTIGQPMIVDGFAIVNVPLLFQQKSSGGATIITTTVTCYIRKYDGTTETDLVSGAVEVSSISPHPPVGENQYRMIAFGLTVPRTDFKSGEKVRITITTSAPGATKGILILHDPKDTDKTDIVVKTPNSQASGTITYETSAPSILSVQLPLVID